VIVGALVEGDLAAVANREDVEKAHQRASRNRDKALSQFPPTVQWKKDGVLLYDASSNAIRRERFAAFYHHPDILYSVGVIPTRAGFHVSAGENPWNPPRPGAHVGEIMETYGGGGHKSVGGANPPRSPTRGASRPRSPRSCGPRSSRRAERERHGPAHGSPAAGQAERRARGAAHAPGAPPASSSRCSRAVGANAVPRADRARERAEQGGSWSGAR
jgi:hypothetical protein